MAQENRSECLDRQLVARSFYENPGRLDEALMTDLGTGHVRLEQHTARAVKDICRTLIDIDKELRLVLSLLPRQAREKIDQAGVAGLQEMRPRDIVTIVKERVLVVEEQSGHQRKSLISKALAGLLAAFRKPEIDRVNCPTQLKRKRTNRERRELDDSLRKGGDGPADQPSAEFRVCNSSGCPFLEVMNASNMIDHVKQRHFPSEGFSVRMVSYSEWIRKTCAWAIQERMIMLQNPFRNSEGWRVEEAKGWSVWLAKRKINEDVSWEKSNKTLILDSLLPTGREGDAGMFVNRMKELELVGRQTKSVETQTVVLPDTSQGSGERAVGSPDEGRVDDRQEGGRQSRQQDPPSEPLRTQRSDARSFNSRIVTELLEQIQRQQHLINTLLSTQNE